MTGADALAALLARVAASDGEPARFSERELAEWPAVAVAQLKAEGLLVKGPPADVVSCPGCEDDCAMTLETATTAGGKLRAFVVCDRRDDVARVAIPRDAIEQWQCSPVQLAAQLAKFLGLRRPLSDNDPKRLDLGVLKGTQGSAHVVLHVENLLTLHVAGHVLPLADLVDWTDTRPDLVRDVLRERGRYVSAALTIIRAWIAAGRPKTECKSLASYGDWSDLCRQPLLWLGCPDPTASVFEAMAEDPDRETLSRLLHAWFATFGKTPAMVREAVNRTAGMYDQASELREVLHDIAAERGEINRRKLGWWIRRHAGRIVDGLRIERAVGGGNGSAERWRIEVVESVSPVSSVLVGAGEKSVSGGDGASYARASRGD